MRNLVFSLGLFVSMLSVQASAETFFELLNGEDTPDHTRVEQGVLAQQDYSSRTMIVSGYKYMVGTNFQTPVTLFGTSAGSFELLKSGMKLEIEYFDLGEYRLAIRIEEIDFATEVEF